MPQVRRTDVARSTGRRASLRQVWDEIPRVGLRKAFKHVWTDEKGGDVPEGTRHGPRRAPFDPRALSPEHNAIICPRFAPAPDTRADRAPSRPPLAVSRPVFVLRGTDSVSRHGHARLAPDSIQGRCGRRRVRRRRWGGARRRLAHRGKRGRDRGFERAGGRRRERAERRQNRRVVAAADVRAGWSFGTRRGRGHARRRDR